MAWATPRFGVIEEKPRWCPDAGPRTVLGTGSCCSPRSHGRGGSGVSKETEAQSLRWEGAAPQPALSFRWVSGGTEDVPPLRPVSRSRA